VHQKPISGVNTVPHKLGGEGWRAPPLGLDTDGARSLHQRPQRLALTSTFPLLDFSHVRIPQLFEICNYRYWDNAAHLHCAHLDSCQLSRRSENIFGNCPLACLAMNSTPCFCLFDPSSTCTRPDHRLLWIITCQTTSLESSNMCGVDCQRWLHRIDLLTLTCIVNCAYQVVVERSERGALE